MLYRNLTIKELYASIPATSIVKEMFVNGLKIGSTQLAISAMEELIVRGDTDIIQHELDFAFKEGYVKIGTPMSALIARSLMESCREADPFLQRFGKFLFRAKTNDPFTEFAESFNYCSGSEQIEQLARFCKFVDLERPMDLDVAIETGLFAKRLERPEKTKELLRELGDYSFLEWMKKALFDSGINQVVIDKWFSEMTPGQLAKIKKDVIGN